MPFLFIFFGLFSDIASYLYSIVRSWWPLVREKSWLPEGFVSQRMGVTNLQVAEPHRICRVRGTVSRNQCLGWVCIREGSDHCQHRALKPPSPSASRAVLSERVTEEPPTAGLDCQSPFTGATSQGHTFPSVWEEGRAVLES